MKYYVKYINGTQIYEANSLNSNKIINTANNRIYPIVSNKPWITIEEAILQNKLILLKTENKEEIFEDEYWNKYIITEVSDLNLLSLSDKSLFYKLLGKIIKNKLEKNLPLNRFKIKKVIK